MNKRTTCLILVLIFGTTAWVQAQQDPQFSQYMLNRLQFNPAFAGVDGVTQLTAVHRNQWTGYDTSFDGPGGNPTTQFVGLNSSLLKLRSGVGVTVVNDNLGALNNLEAKVSFAYHLGIKESKLSFGMSAGFFNQVINWNEYRPIDPNDPVLSTGQDSQVRPDLALGLYYNTEKYYLGFSVDHLIKSEFDFGVSDLKNALQPHAYFTAGYNYEMNYNIMLTPSVLVKSDFNAYTFDLSVLATYEDKMWAGLSLRELDAAILLLGYSFFKDNSLRLGYSFDYTLKDQDAKAITSHEILISYVLPPATAAGKKVIRTPRFRH